MPARVLTKFAARIRDILSQRPDTTYYDLPGELMEELHLTSAEDAENVLEALGGRKDVHKTILHALMQNGGEWEGEVDAIQAARMIIGFLVHRLVADLFGPVAEEDVPIPNYKWEEAVENFDKWYLMPTVFEDLYYDFTEEMEL